MGKNWGQGTAINPADTFEAITKSDTVNLSNVTRGIWVGGAGDVAVVGQDEVAVTLAGVAAGTLLPVVCIRVNDTNTTASSMVGLS